MAKYSPEIEAAMALGWKESACELIDHGLRYGFESPDGRTFLTGPQLSQMMRTGQVDPIEPLSQPH